MDLPLLTHYECSHMMVSLSYYVTIRIPQRIKAARAAGRTNELEYLEEDKRICIMVYNQLLMASQYTASVYELNTIHRCIQWYRDYIVIANDPIAFFYLGRVLCHIQASIAIKKAEEQINQFVDGRNNNHDGYGRPYPIDKGEQDEPTN